MVSLKELDGWGMGFVCHPNAQSRVRVNGQYSEGFGVGVSALHPGTGGAFLWVPHSCTMAASLSGLGSNTFYQIQIQIQIHFPEFQIQIHRQKSDQTQIQIQIPLIKYKEKNTNTQWGRDKIAAILQMTYQNLLYCKKIVLFIQISLTIVSKGPIYNKHTLLQIMAWCWVGNKPLSDQWWPGLLMHKCITRPKWVNVKRSVADCYLNVV